MNRDRLLLLTPLREALERIARKSEPLLICQDALPGMLSAIRSLEERTEEAS